MGKSKDLASGNSAAYVETAGDTMSGALNVNGGNLSVNSTSEAAHRYLYLNTGATNDGHILFQRAGSPKYQISSDTSNNLFTWNYTKNGTSFRINADGSIITPHQPSFLAYGSPSWTTISSGVTAEMSISNEAYDVGSNYANSRFTAPVAGKYLLNLHAYVRVDTQQDSGSHGYTYIRKNGSNYFQSISIFGYFNNGDADQMSHVTVIMDMAANDYASGYFTAASGACSYYGGTSQFMGYLLG